MFKTAYNLKRHKFFTHGLGKLPKRDQERMESPDYKPRKPRRSKADKMINMDELYNTRMPTHRVDMPEASSTGTKLEYGDTMPTYRVDVPQVKSEDKDKDKEQGSGDKTTENKVDKPEDNMDNRSGNSTNKSDSTGEKAPENEMDKTPDLMNVIKPLDKHQEDSHQSVNLPSQSVFPVPERQENNKEQVSLACASAFLSGQVGERPGGKDNLPEQDAAEPLARLPGPSAFLSGQADNMPK